ncbi:MAG: signal peptidase I [Terriglobales bacterium]
MRKTIRHLVRVIAPLMCAGFLLLAFEVAVVPTGSMEKTVLVGDTVLVFKLFDGPTIPGLDLRLPRLRSPRRGDLVSFYSPTAAHSVYLKRVVAVAGDIVEIRDGLLYVNGALLKESYAPRSTRVPNLAPRRIVPGELFVLGDNRDLSEDSRDFGAIPLQAVIGRPVAVVWSARARTPELLDTQGDVRLGFYWSVLFHPLDRIRWSRTGKLL